MLGISNSQLGRLVSEIMDAVCLFLHENGPTPLTELSIILGYPAITLRTHLDAHCGTRYTFATDLSLGFPVKRWRLMTAQEIAENE